MTVPTDRRPIGFWVQVLNRALDERLAATLGETTRRQWQVLNVVEQGAASQAGIDERVRPFLEGPTDTSASEVAMLIERGWVTPADPHALTEVGAREFAHLLELVAADRRLLMEGVPPEEYARTVGTLEQMARNLGWVG